VKKFEKHWTKTTDEVQGEKSGPKRLCTPYV